MIMKKFTVAKLLAFVVIIAGIAVMVGWILNIGILKSILPYWTTMKFSTAICFVASGIMIYSIVLALDGKLDQAQIIIPATVLIVVLTMGIFFFSAILNIRTGVEDIFIKEGPRAIKSMTSGRPAVSTTMNFILISIAGMFTLIDAKNLRSRLKTIGLIVALIGAVAVIGYILNAPILYYFIKGLSTAMACNTAILFVLSGMGLICLSD